MSVDEITSAFYYDGDSQLEVAKFPEDFADWLMNEGREQEAREFLARWNRLEETTPYEQVTFELAQDLAEEYAPVVDFAEEIRDPDTDSEMVKALFGIFREREATEEPWSDDPTPSWDREAELVKQVLEDQMPIPLDLDKHEFPHVKVYVKRSAKIPEIVFRTFQELGTSIDTKTAMRFIQDLLFLTNGPATDGEIFLLCWSYVNIVPTE